MCQGGGKPDAGKFHSSYIGMNVYVALPMRMGAWLMACVLRRRIEYYYQTIYTYCTMIYIPTSCFTHTPCSLNRVKRIVETSTHT